MQELILGDADALLAMVAAGVGSVERVSTALVAGNRVWIKRHDTKDLPLPRRLHARISPLIAEPFLRASPRLTAEGMLARDERKMKAFAAAGFLVPRILGRQGAVHVLADVGPTIQDRLDAADDDGVHERLLIDCARAVGRAHAAGLCHGRPHPRDFFETDGMYGFLDFEEEPEAAMPLASAQARDAWLLFLQIAAQARTAETSDRAFAAYRALAPAATLAELLRVTRGLRFIVPILRAMRHVRLGGDGRRLLQAMELFEREFAAAPQA
jgi:hypothetical protein